MAGTLSDRNRWTVPLSLALSYALNDGEELLTMGRGRLPQRHVTVAVGWIGVLIVAAVAGGVRTRGRGRLYQDVQQIFGAHGFIHLAASLLARGYTTGVATAPIVLLQWRCARRRLDDAGVPASADPRRGALLMGAWLATAHALGALAARRR